MSHRLEKKADRMSELMQDHTSDSNSIQLMQENMQLQLATINQLKEENKRLRRQLVALMNLSPFRSPPSKKATEAALPPLAGMESFTAKRPCMDNSFKSVTAPSLATGMPFHEPVLVGHSIPAVAAAPSISSMGKSFHSALDGIHNTSALKVSGVTVSKDLERLWNKSIIQKKKLAACGTDVKKKILYDHGHHLFVGHHPVFAGNEASTYENGMTVVAMSLTKQQWNTMLEGQLDCNANRLLFASVKKESLETCLQLEVETGLKERGKKSAAKPGLHSIGSRFWAIKKKWKELGNSDLEIANMILQRVGDGGGQGEQTLIRNYFGGKK